jgi:hypothetical protein
LLFATQNAFSRASTARRPRREHVDVQGAELREQLARRLDVVVEAILARALEHHDQIRERLGANLVGDAELEPQVVDHRRHGHQVDVLEHQRADTARDDARHGRGHLLERRERRQYGGGVRERRG